MHFGKRDLASSGCPREISELISFPQGRNGRKMLEIHGEEAASF
jgi:hypothetical protein